MNERRQWMKLSSINFNMKMTPSNLLTSVFYDHLSFKRPWNNLVKYEIKNKDVISTTNELI